MINDYLLPGDSTLPSPPEVIAALIADGENAQHRYQVEDFFRLPEMSSFQLSHDGAFVSYLGPYQRRNNIFIMRLDDPEMRQITHETERDIEGYFWANAERLIYIKDQAGDENYQLYAVNADGSDFKALTPYEQVRIQLIDDLEDDHDHVIIGMNLNNPQLFDPYRINVYTGELEQLAENDNEEEPMDGWMTDHEGRLRLAVRIKDGVNTTLMYRDDEDEEFREVITTDFRDSITPLFFDFEQPHLLYVTSNLGRDKAVLIKFDLHTGQESGPVLFEHPEVDVTSAIYSKKRKINTGAVYTTDKTHVHFFDSWRKNLQTNLEQRLPGYEVDLAHTDKAENLYLVITHSDRSRGAYHLYNATTDELKLITIISPWLDEQDMAVMQPIKYQARDGYSIHGYLSLPPGQAAKNLPVVINPHGGPWVRDEWGYNPEVQLLCSRGYAVLQMNYRGSTGYGKTFWTASFKQWGRSMQDDITDGVQWLIQEGIADPERIAIYGGSYGGYATLAGVTFTPDLYTCAIDYVGVSNLFTFMNTIPPYWKPYLSMMYEMVGNPEEEAEMMEAASPVYHIDKITTPLFVIQGANDPRVNIDESDQIVKSLREHGVDVPYLVKYDEGHGFHNEENRFEVYKAMLGFLKKYIG